MRRKKTGTWTNVPMMVKPRRVKGTMSAKERVRLMFSEKPKRKDR